MGWSRSGAVSWAERCAELAAGSKVDAVYRLRRNLHPQYGGLEMELVDLICPS
jgi:single-stranded-DNA-specific exonuclease